MACVCMNVSVCMSSPQGIYMSEAFTNNMDAVWIAEQLINIFTKFLWQLNTYQVKGVAIVMKSVIANLSKETKIRVYEWYFSL